MGSVGDAYDNALCESFFATVECELLDRTRFATPAAARTALFDFIEGWYNPRRRHSALGYLSPIGYERAHSGRTPIPPSPPETAAAVLPPGAPLEDRAAISLFPPTGHSRSVTRRARV